jgi:hypothetical protein
MTKVRGGRGRRSRVVGTSRVGSCGDPVPARDCYVTSQTSSRFTVSRRPAERMELIPYIQLIETGLKNDST